VFGWRVRRDRDEPAFEDGTGHVIGHFVRSQAVAGADGVRPYVFVQRVDATLEKAVAEGAEVVDAPLPRGRSPGCDDPRPGRERRRRLADGPREP